MKDKERDFKMADNKIEELFKGIVATTTLLQESLNTTNHDALAESLHDLLAGEVYVENGAPNQQTVDKLNSVYKELNLSGLTVQQLLELMQLLILNAEKNDSTEVNKLMTPGIIAVMTSLILHEIIKATKKENITIVDPTIGDGNLLLQVIANIKAASDVSISSIGIDNDDILLSVADSYAQLLDVNVDLYYQDAVTLWPVSDVDFVIADLPVGFYPIDDNHDQFVTKAEKGHSYAHHLLIENSMNHLKDGAFGLFVVPSEIFKTNQSQTLAKWMVSNVYLQGILSFPSELFYSKEAQKSIVILQKHGDNAKQVKNVLMGEIPSPKKIEQFKKFQQEIENWANENFK